MALNAKLGQASTRRHNDAEDAIGALFANSQFLCGWQFAAGASTAGFLENAAADLERELRTFRYPAIVS